MRAVVTDWCAYFRIGTSTGGVEGAGSSVEMSMYQSRVSD